jgi:hypothetical protein
VTSLPSEVRVQPASNPDKEMLQMSAESLITKPLARLLEKWF